MNKYLPLVCLLLSLFTDLLAQEQTFTLHKDSITFNEVISVLEDETHTTFYFKQEWVDTLVYNIHFEAYTIKEILNSICAETKLNYYYIDNNVVAFTHGYKLVTDYADDYSDYIRLKEAYRVTTEHKPPPRVNYEQEIVSLEYQTYTIGSPSLTKASKTATLSGVIRDIQSGSPLIGAIVYFEELKEGCVSNAYGLYTITVPIGQYKVEYQSLGMRTTYRNINIYSDGVLDVELASKPFTMDEVTVRAQSEDKVKNLRMGMEKISVISMKRLPTGLGEADILKSTLLLPGVQAVSEASAGFNVRGGSIDQNLILWGGAPIMNTSHFFGFFSGFNADLVKDVTLYKSGVPAKYGGRASSVMDINLMDGNRKKTNINGGVSPISGRLTVDGPIVKDKSSFIIGGRSNYSNWVLKQIDDLKIKNSKADFYDIQAKLSFDLNENNSLYISGYKSHDKFDYYSEDAFDYNSLASTISWKKVFNPKFFSTFSATMSQYDYTMESRQDSAMHYKVKYKIDQYLVRSDFTYFTDKRHKLDFGLNSTWYNLSPGEREPVGESSVATSKYLEKERALETSLYISDEFKINHRLSLSGGIRLNSFGNFGPKTQLSYLDASPRHVDYIKDTVEFGSGKLLKFYANPEFRFSSNFILNNSSSLKFGVTRMYQYIQMISNTASMSPTDIWKLSDNFIKPLRSDQFSIGYYYKFGKAFELSTECYYKNLNNIIDYKGGAQLVMNEHLETDVLNGKGKAYGVELMLEKKSGKMTGWVNYTYSRILHRIETYFVEEQVNNGDYFPANYDKPHDLKIIANYKSSRRTNLSGSFYYSSGRPFTAPISYYRFRGTLRPYYSDRNGLRMDDYIRLDLAATLHGNLVRKKLNHSSWTFSVYNVLGRKNPYSIYFRSEGGKVKGYKMSIYGQPIFLITYNFKFLGNAEGDF